MSADFKRKGNELRDKRNNLLGKIDGKYIRDSRNRKIGIIDASYIRDDRNTKVASFDGNYIRDSHNSRIATTKDVVKLIDDASGSIGDVALWYFFVR